MKKSILFVTIALYCHVCPAQNFQQEINEQVWLPFLKASSEFNGDAFMALQSRDFIRASIDQKEIHGYSVYEQQIVPNFKRIQQEGRVKRTTEMRFIERIASGDMAYEIGYFKGTTTLPNGEIRIRYSLFYIVLRKENGFWKILVDADTSKGNSITEDMFQAAAPL